MNAGVKQRLDTELTQFKKDGVYKELNYLDSSQGPVVQMEGRGDVIILSTSALLTFRASLESGSSEKTNVTATTIAATQAPNGIDLRKCMRDLLSCDESYMCQFRLIRLGRHGDAPPSQKLTQILPG